MNLDEIAQINENLYFVPGERKGRFPACHGFLLDGEETVLIDSGVGEKRIKAIDREKRIDILIISHSHPDHIRCWNLLHDRVIMVPNETPHEITNLDLLGERFTGSPENGRKWAKFANSFGVVALREPDQRYAHGELLQLGGCNLEAIHTPGHLKDHYCFFERNTSTLITTDIDLTSFGPWYGNPEADIEVFREDVKKVMAFPYKRVCSSHRLPIEGDATEQFEGFLGSFDRQRQAVLELCGQPRTLEDVLVASPFYRNAFPNKEIQRLFETNLVKKNLELLQRDGLVRRSNNRYLRTSL
jgi:glyoxylase-like metal-dependent hydrolase (beta-lactamase superfamily II)